MFKETSDGETYYDPEAERKARENEPPTKMIEEKLKEASGHKWGVDSEGAIYVHTERGNIPPEEYVKDFLSQFYKEMIEKEIAEMKEMKKAYRGEQYRYGFEVLNDLIDSKREALRKIYKSNLPLK